MITLIDGDIVVYRCAASCEPNKIKLEREPLEFAIARADELLYRICNSTSTQEYRVFLSGSENFRKTLDPSYKANRTQPKPQYLDAIRNFCIEEWDATVAAGCEADDRIGIAANSETIIATIDKDLRQIPGWHYNFVKDEMSEVSPRDAIGNFYHQMLTGDRSDNVIGIPGIGDIRAGRALSGRSPKEMEAYVRDCYGETRGLDAYVHTYNLLYIIRSEAALQQVEQRIRDGLPPIINELNSFNYVEENHPF